MCAGKWTFLNERKQKSEVNPGIAQAAEEVTSPVFI